MGSSEDCVVRDPEFIPRVFFLFLSREPPVPPRGVAGSGALRERRSRRHARLAQGTLTSLCASLACFGPFVLPYHLHSFYAHVIFAIFCYCFLACVYTCACTMHVQYAHVCIGMDKFGESAKYQVSSCVHVHAHAQLALSISLSALS